MTIKFQTTYTVFYQKPGDNTWWQLDSILYRHGTKYNEFEETTDLDEAIDVATKVKDGLNYPIRPGFTRVGAVQATQVIQRIMGGGPILTFGNPVQTRKTDERTSTDTAEEP